MRKIIGLLILVALLIIGVAIVQSGVASRTQSKKEVVSTTSFMATTETEKEIIHRSQFFRYEEPITRAIDEVKPGDIPKDPLAGVISHHLPTTISLIADFYVRLNKARSVDTFIIVSPNHFNRGDSPIITSKASFQNPYGTLKPDLTIINTLEQSGLVTIDETPFDLEHGIDTHLLYIKKLFPNAKAVPIIFKASASHENARKLGELIAKSSDSKKIMVISSIDFSHYLLEAQARPLDNLSKKILEQGDLKNIENIRADSPQALSFMMAYLHAKSSKIESNLKVYNAADFGAGKDNTTGYVVGFFSSPSDH